MLLKYLKLEQVDKVFGIPGSAIEKVIFDFTKQRDQFEYIISRHEGSAAYMAEGYYLATGKLGVCMSTSGPGATNLFTGAVNAHFNGSPLLAISGEQFSANFGKGLLQEGVGVGLNLTSVFDSGVHKSGMPVSPLHFKTFLEQQLRDSLTTPCKATHISLSRDVASGSLPEGFEVPKSVSAYRSTANGSADYETAKAVVKQFSQAKRPMIYIGNGTRNILKGERLERFTQMVEKFGWAVSSTVSAKGIFPENHRNSLRNFGMGACDWAKEYMTSLDGSYDGVIVLGSNLMDLSTQRWNPILKPNHGPFIQVDLNSSVLGRAYATDQGIIAELGAFVDQMIKASEEVELVEVLKQERVDAIAAVKAENPYRDAEKIEMTDEELIMPQALMRSMSDVIPEGSHLFIDGGNCIGWSSHYMTVSAPTAIHYSLNMGAMGAATCGVIGAKLGDPSKHMIALVGDGAFLMHGSEISVAARYNVGSIWIILDDQDLGMVSQGMQEYYPDGKMPAHEYSMHNTDLKAFSEAQGADAYNVTNIEDFENAFAEAIKRSEEFNKPQVIVAKINREEVAPFYPVKKKK